MDGREIEPRIVMWAVADVCWLDSAGHPIHAAATLEDTSRSGACLRLKSAIQIGSQLTVKWHREQFSAIARNCRRDGREFLLGVHREPGLPMIAPAPPASKVSNSHTPEACSLAPAISHGQIPPNQALKPERIQRSAPALSISEPRTPSPAASPCHERTFMQPRKVFPRFWRSQLGPETSQQPIPTEAPVNKPTTHATPSAPRGELLSYQDIYHAAGILNPPSGYGIDKVVDMLNNEHLRDLSKDIRRASVLMALDAAGMSVSDLLQDATRRQQALESYEAAKRKQLEEFESLKSQEISRIEAELERLKTHYAGRIQKNREQVEHEKESLRNWQMAMQHENQRISDVIELCRKPSAGAGVTTPASAEKLPADKTSAESAPAAMKATV
ncbi:MAG TPA: hypothetical protein VMB66_03875 [Candidatus Acidoferrales bacterium]|nr:hypothetical protein [Candidatus Acidoferrales bacterium]